MPAAMLATYVLALGCGRLDFTSLEPADAFPYQYVAFESESGAITPVFGVMNDPAASGGAYVIDTNFVGVTGAGSVANTFMVGASPRPFYIWARVLAPNDAADSFRLSVDGSPSRAFRTCVNGLSPDWQWVVVTEDCPAGPDCCGATTIEFALAAGAHELELTSREGGSTVDAVVVTDDASYTGGF